MPLTPVQAVALVNTLAAEIRARRADRGGALGVETLENYFDGRHPLKYMSEEWRQSHELRYKGFSDNWCEVVGRAAPERTEVFGLRLGDDLEVQSPDEKDLWRDWQLNEGPAQSAQGFLSSAVAKRSYALVWGDENDEPVLTWEHASQATVGYSDSSQRVSTSSLKLWRDDEREYATLYTADEVWKFSRTPGLEVSASGETPSGLIVPPGALPMQGWSLRDGVDTNPMRR